MDGITQTLNSPALSAALVVTDGAHQWRVRAFDRAGNQSGWSNYGAFSTSSLKSYLPLLLKNYAAPQPPSAATCTDSIVNGGFESGNLNGWSRPSQNPPAAIITANVYRGGYAARVGAATTSDLITQPSYSSLQQNLSVPANAITATLSFARYSYSGDASDLQYVVVLSGTSTDYLVFDRVNDPQWLSGTFDLLEYAGQTITLRFGAYNNGSGGTTGMALDDVHTQICVPQ